MTYHIDTHNIWLYCECNSFRHAFLQVLTMDKGRALVLLIFYVPQVREHLTYLPDNKIIPENSVFLLLSHIELEYELTSYLKVKCET